MLEVEAITLPITQDGTLFSNSTLLSLADFACVVCIKLAHLTLSCPLIPRETLPNIANIHEGYLKCKSNGTRQQRPPASNCRFNHSRHFRDNLYLSSLSGFGSKVLQSAHNIPPTAEKCAPKKSRQRPLLNTFLTHHIGTQICVRLKELKKTRRPISASWHSSTRLWLFSYFLTEHVNDEHPFSRYPRPRRYAITTRFLSHQLDPKSLKKKRQHSVAGPDLEYCPPLCTPNAAFVIPKLGLTS